MLTMMGFSLSSPSGICISGGERHYVTADTTVQNTTAPAERTTLGESTILVFASSACLLICVALLSLSIITISKNY